MNALAFVAGLLVVALDLVGVLYVLILPRAPTGIGRLSLVVIRGVHLAFSALSRLSRRYERKDSLLALVAPVALVVQLLSWAVGLTVGFALMLVPTTHSLSQGLSQSLTALFTVGAIHIGGRANTAIDIASGSTWVIVVALQIAYLPSLYSKFAHREGLVTLLETRAGSPTWGPEMLVRFQFAGIIDTIGDFYSDWENWAAEISESHTTYPVLLYFRSPDPWSSWILGLLTVLDAAALHMAVSPRSAPAQARVLLHTGFVTFQRLAASMGWPVDHAPTPDSAIALTFAEFSHAVDILVKFGPRPERSAAESWEDFRGWRMNYESCAYRLAEYFTAPPAQWSGPRRHVRPDDLASYAPLHQLLNREAGELTAGPHVAR